MPLPNRLHHIIPVLSHPADSSDNNAADSVSAPWPLPEVGAWHLLQSPLLPSLLASLYRLRGYTDVDTAMIASGTHAMVASVGAGARLPADGVGGWVSEAQLVESGHRWVSLQLKLAQKLVRAQRDREAAYAEQLSLLADAAEVAIFRAAAAAFQPTAATGGDSGEAHVQSEFEPTASGQKRALHPPANAAGCFAKLSPLKTPHFFDAGSDSGREAVPRIAVSSHCSAPASAQASSRARPGARGRGCGRGTYKRRCARQTRCDSDSTDSESDSEQSDACTVSEEEEEEEEVEQVESSSSSDEAEEGRRRRGSQRVNKRSGSSIHKAFAQSPDAGRFPKAEAPATGDGPSSRRKQRPAPSKGKQMPAEVTAVLMEWLLDHVDHPYPNSGEKAALMAATGLDAMQLRNWLTNQRKRHLKPVLLAGRKPRSQLEALMHASATGGSEAAAALVLGGDGAAAAAAAAAAGGGGTGRAAGGRGARASVAAAAAAGAGNKRIGGGFWGASGGGRGARPVSAITRSSAASQRPGGWQRGHKRAPEEGSWEEELS